MLQLVLLLTAGTILALGTMTQVWVASTIGWQPGSAPDKSQGHPSQQYASLSTIVLSQRVWSLLMGPYGLPLALTWDDNQVLGHVRVVAWAARLVVS
jgi:hypothetical protein